MADRKLTRTRHPGIYRRGDRYVVVYRVGGKQRKIAARTLAEARRVKAARVTDRDRGEHFEPTRARFGAFAREWVETYNGRHGRFRESTRGTYRQALDRAIHHFGERHKLAEITAQDVAGFVRWLCDDAAQTRYVNDRRRERGLDPKPGIVLSDATIANAVKPLRALLSTAAREGLIRHNPAADIPLPRREDGDEDEDTRALTRAELATFLRVVTPKHGPMFRLMASTGLRISEALALEWRDLEVETRPAVKVRRRFYRGDLGAPKTASGKRTVPLAPVIAAELRKRKIERKPKSADLVFPNEDGNLLHVENLRRRHFNPAIEEAGAGWAGFHALRHTFASLLFERRVNPVQIQRWLGHASLKVTLDTYTHLIPDDEVDPLDLSAELDGKGGNVGATQATETDRNEDVVAEAEAALAGAIPS